MLPTLMLAAAITEVWLVAKLHGGGVDMMGWMQGGTLQRRVAEGGAGWLARLRGEGKEWWNVEKFSWESNR